VAERPTRTLTQAPNTYRALYALHVPDEPPRPLLTRFLANKDLPCEGCGYNLRGCTTLLCPECGMVIARPPTEQVAQFEGRHQDLLWCPKCRYSLGKTPGDHCPQCNYKLLREENSKRKRRGTLRGVPWPLVFLAIFAALEVVPIFAKYATSTSRLTPTATVIALAALLVPLSLTVMFWLGRRKLDEMTTKGFWLLTALATILSLVCIISAARLL
jgi:hypothetical protein